MRAFFSCSRRGRSGQPSPRPPRAPRAPASANRLLPIVLLPDTFLSWSHVVWCSWSKVFDTMTKEKEDEEDPNAISSREAMKMVNGMLDKMVRTRPAPWCRAQPYMYDAHGPTDTCKLTRGLGVCALAGRPVRNRRGRGHGRPCVPPPCSAPRRPPHPPPLPEPVALLAVDTFKVGVGELDTKVKEIHEQINDTSYLDEGVPPKKK